VTAVKAVASGRTYPEEFGASCAEKSARPAAGSATIAADMLTARESQVLRVLASGAQNKDVAQRLNISVRTVEKHRANIMRKLSLKNQAELVRFALANDIIDFPRQSPHT